MDAILLSLTFSFCKKCRHVMCVGACLPPRFSVLAARDPPKQILLARGVRCDKDGWAARIATVGGGGGAPAATWQGTTEDEEGWGGGASTISEEPNRTWIFIYLHIWGRVQKKYRVTRFFSREMAEFISKQRFSSKPGLSQ